MLEYCSVMLPKKSYFAIRTPKLCGIALKVSVALDVSVFLLALAVNFGSDYVNHNNKHNQPDDD